MAGSDPMNPFESTFDLLQSMREEIHELRRCIAKEESQRVREISEIRQQVVDLEYAKNFELDKAVNTVQELSKSNNARLDKFEAHMDELRATKHQGFDMLDAKIEAETILREQACHGLDRALGNATLTWRACCQKIDADEAANQKLAADMQEVKTEIQNVARCLCDNSLTRDPFKHFHARPGAVLAAPARAAKAADAPPGWLTHRGPGDRIDALLASARGAGAPPSLAEPSTQPLAEPSPSPGQRRLRFDDGLAKDRFSSSCSSLAKLRVGATMEAWPAWVNSNPLSPGTCNLADSRGKEEGIATLPQA